ncbi:hypothetical protein GCM10011387_24240 [Pedobacter quisquiliarum]|jgi:hypothetical protein|uniref:DUF4783 domain-containing protein n=1 Tax=Pedobacter quisquiliarum TaxID=1834438 RepID=A0A916XGE9_9SPHI|nr:DUF4783 domain-containing protein [Pedobacter quisquiliarum]GGC69965.1 hypothetical protein GCM10011387_24240 [Pedobacter quisquiliarum]
MIRSLVPILFVITGLLFPLQFQSNLVGDVSGHFRNGNSKEIAKYFNASVELNIASETDTYSKAQAEQILRDFFNKNMPVNSSVIHLINTNPNYQIGILSVLTKTVKYRVTVTFKKTSGDFLITELRIEGDKT